MKIVYEIMAVRFDGKNYWKKGYAQIALFARATNTAGQEVCQLAAWWSNKHGWLVPLKKNVRHYSHLTTLPTIDKAARRAKEWLLAKKPEAVVDYDQGELETVAAKL